MVDIRFQNEKQLFLIRQRTQYADSRERPATCGAGFGGRAALPTPASSTPARRARAFRLSMPLTALRPSRYAGNEKPAFFSTLSFRVDRFCEKKRAYHGTRAMFSVMCGALRQPMTARKDGHYMGTPVWIGYTARPAIRSMSARPVEKKVVRCPSFPPAKRATAAG